MCECGKGRRCFCTSNFNDLSCGCTWEWLGKNSERKDKYKVSLCESHKISYEKWVENCKKPELKNYPNIPIYKSVNEILSHFSKSEVEVV